VKLLCYHANWQLSMLHEGKLYCVLRLGPHYFFMSKCKAVKHVKTYLSPFDVEEFCAGILGAGTGLAPLLKIEYPSADLVSAALCDVLEVVVVKGCSTKGKWVTSWASSAKNVYLVTFDICEVSGRVPCLI